MKTMMITRIQAGCVLAAFVAFAAAVSSHAAYDVSDTGLEGTIQIWWEDISRFQLVLDDNFLVRQAAIQSNVKGFRTEFEVKTEGSVTAEGFEFAKSGSFKRITLGMEVEGKLAAKPRIQKEFQAEFKGVQFHLSDARYGELVAMIPDPGTQVFDHVSDKVYFVGEEEKAWPLLPPPAGVALGGQADRPAHEWLSAYQARKTNWFGAVRPIVRSTNGVPDLIRELSCPDAKHRELACALLGEVHSDAQCKDATAPTNSVAWIKWWEQTGRTNSAERLWHNFDSHYQ